MSTKMTVDHGETHHLYHELFDAEGIYLRLEDVDFGASPNMITVRIPIELWERIRQHRATPEITLDGDVDE